MCARCSVQRLLPSHPPHNSNSRTLQCITLPQQRNDYCNSSKTRREPPEASAEGVPDTAGEPRAKVHAKGYQVNSPWVQLYLGASRSVLNGAGLVAHALAVLFFLPRRHLSILSTARHFSAARRRCLTPPRRLSSARHSYPCQVLSQSLLSPTPALSLPRQKIDSTRREWVGGHRRPSPLWHADIYQSLLLPACSIHFGTSSSL